jgi:hypothetical protein
VKFYLENLKEIELEDGNIISKYVNDRTEIQWTQNDLVKVNFKFKFKFIGQLNNCRPKLLKKGYVP